jgi:hypothetical protein
LSYQPSSFDLFIYLFFKIAMQLIYPPTGIPQQAAGTPMLFFNPTTDLQRSATPNQAFGGAIHQSVYCQQSSPAYAAPPYLPTLDTPIARPLQQHPLQLLTPSVSCGYVSQVIPPFSNSEIPTVISSVHSSDYSFNMRNAAMLQQVLQNNRVTPTPESRSRLIDEYDQQSVSATTINTALSLIPSATASQAQAAEVFSSSRPMNPNTQYENHWGVQVMHPPQNHGYNNMYYTHYIGENGHFSSPAQAHMGAPPVGAVGGGSS